ncbi:hypothetical protein Bra3105_17850 [Brachybacterium halotolerans subsp. kimchii]|uniref:hypothetical protein n=1 Tax=Brachybacterium halotolerans TaxID=2795215 RepID=UPI001E2AC52A|nr:hypothetical protein [Brachybacterium halotolerans]UEJ82666.1 hypothetical protein Bra3105_17850 [Brachybacterium halotolerans subsp. kimchii]
MAFTKVKKNKSKRGRAAADPIVTVSKAHMIGLNQAAYEAIGAPAHCYLEWDTDACLLRIVACTGDDPNSFPLGHKNGTKFGARQVLRDLGLDPKGTTRQFPARRDTRLSLIADLSDMPAAGGGIVPMRRTA